MSTDDKTLKRLDHFFGSFTDKKHFANTMRVFLYESIGMSLKIDPDTQWSIDKEAIADGYFWLNQLCETLDPQLFKED